ncbi:AraC family transcriptional regulator protein (plasmid) [Rhizobium etli 8C-3]|uniref:AraC family transcriptional regulator protein n=2 Tax=Rhizobium TaxID=379 RepID=A0A1L5PG09_RHIET|nr:MULTISPECIES: helix-turn-helix domain-containing protein [Rhizobium]APO79128.1 AraC family transcriptional regulator protein [Rhizobium etli 8C-3]TCU29097.1 AraC family transcriptional activator of pobA [Rhizobium azibense]
MTKSAPTYDLYGESAGKKPDFWLHCETIPSRSSLHGWEIRLHRHENFLQILYINAGSGDAIFAQERHAIRPRSVITVPPGLKHGFRFSKDIDGFVITVLASHLKSTPGDRSRFGQWLAKPQLTGLDMQDQDAAYVAQTLTRLGEEFSGRRSGRSDLLDAYLTSALQLTARICEGAESEVADENSRRMEVLSGLVQQYLRAHKPVAFYARELGISPAHLNRIVKTATGNSVRELIARKLTEEAKRELLFTLASVQEISYRLGFADSAYFSRFFLNRVGETPRTWRIAERTRLAV